MPIAEVMADPVARERGLSVTQEVPGTGSCTMPGVSPRLSDYPGAGRPPAAPPGGTAEEVLASVGLADRLDALQRRWVVRATDLPAAWP